MVNPGSIPLQPESPSPDELPASGPTQAAIRALARLAGFTEAAIVPLPHRETERDAARFEKWIDNGRAGTMAYLGRRDQSGELLRGRADRPFPWANSAVVCLASYHSGAPLSTEAAPPSAGWIARYAWTGKTDSGGAQLRPSDYHKVLLKRLKSLEERMRGCWGRFESRAYVDTGPVVERSLAHAAGLGWTGKNTCLIHPKLGSWNFLAVLLTSLPVAEVQAPLSIPDRCGSCRRCLDACPTQALVEPYQMDATRCISYLTIEHRGPVPEELRGGIGRQLFGCDICQDVCPWNRKAPISHDPEFATRENLVNPDLDWLAGLEFADFEQLFNGSPIRRAGFAGLRRNIAVAMGNSGLSRFLPRLKEWAQATELNRSASQAESSVQSGVLSSSQPDSRSGPTILQEAAQWAIDRITRMAG